MSTETAESYSWYELRAVYATDHATGATIEQVIEGTAPTELVESDLKQLVADATGRMAHSIEHVEVIASGEREHVEDTAIVREGRIELGGIR